MVVSSELKQGHSPAQTKDWKEEECFYLVFMGRTDTVPPRSLGIS